MQKPTSADFRASLVVFLVALPLCVAIARACNLPTEAGLITGIVGGIIVGFMAGCPLQVSGPAAGLIVLAQVYVSETSADPSRYVTLLVLAGLMQILAGTLRLGQWFRAVSPAVVMGMLAGIGMIILIKQFHVMFDQPSPDKIFDALKQFPATLQVFLNAQGFQGARAAGLLAILCIAIMLSWKYIVPKKFAFIPKAVVAVIIATIITVVFNLDVKRVEVAGLADWFAPANAHRLFSMKMFEHFGDGWVWKNAFILAAIASAESLLCATAIDGKQNGPRTKYNRELIAQGIGNAICGLLGALPMTGVIVRSSANVEAGAKTMWSTIFHGFWLLLFTALLPFLLKYIPVASLAAILVLTGWTLLEIPEVKRLWKVSKAEVFIYLITLMGVVFIDLLSGVVIGIICTALYLLWKFSNLEVTRTETTHRIEITLTGAATFMALPRLAKELEIVPPGKQVHVHLDDVTLVDHAILEYIMKFRKQYESKGGSVFLDWEKLHAHFHQKRGPKRPDGGDGMAG